jgi:hypothetical protein
MAVNILHTQIKKNKNEIMKKQAQKMQYKFFHDHYYLRGQCENAIENFLEFLLMTFPLEFSHTQSPPLDCMRKYTVCTSLLSTTENKRRFIY